MAKRKVMPADARAVGMVHPIDGPLATEGSEWTYDAFTHRQIENETIVFFEAPLISKAEPPVRMPVAAVTTEKPKITTR